MTKAKKKTTKLKRVETEKDAPSVDETMDILGKMLWNAQDTGLPQQVMLETDVATLLVLAVRIK